MIDEHPVITETGCYEPPIDETAVVPWCQGRPSKPKVTLQPVRLWSWSEELAAGPIVSDRVMEDNGSSKSSIITAVMVGDAALLETTKELLSPSFKMVTHSENFTLKDMGNSPRGCSIPAGLVQFVKGFVGAVGKLVMGTKNIVPRCLSRLIFASTVVDVVSAHTIARVGRSYTQFVEAYGLWNRNLDLDR